MPPTAAPGSAVVVTDGPHRGEVGRVMAAGGGLVWVKIAGVDEPLGLPDSAVDLIRGGGRKPGSDPSP